MEVDHPGASPLSSATDRQSHLANAASIGNQIADDGIARYGQDGSFPFCVRQSPPGLGKKNARVSTTVCQRRIAHATPMA